MSQKLDQLRAQIDTLDAQILKLLNQRASLAGEVARVKQQEAADDTIVFYRPEREAAVLRKIISDNPGPLPAQESARIFREIMSACLALEQPLTVAYLGPPGTFTQAAALKHFGHSVQTVPLSSIDMVFQEVESGHCHYGVVPVENSSEGMISHTLDMFIHSSLKIVGEVALRIHHHLLSYEKDLAAIQQVFSHQQSLAQCRKWLDKFLPHAERIPMDSNAQAASHVANLQHNGCAAIASGTAAEIYQLPVLSENIEDAADNTTRFLILGREMVASSADSEECITRQCVDKTSLLVMAANKPGALYHLLAPLEENKISMSRIESRPAPCADIWQYVFFIDMEGHVSHPKIKTALEKMREQATQVKVLGAYPRAVI